MAVLNVIDLLVTVQANQVIARKGALGVVLGYALSIYLFCVVAYGKNMGVRCDVIGELLVGYPLGWVLSLYN